jgi:formylglycine-generating enzyme required for sulfatase activity
MKNQFIFLELLARVMTLTMRKKTNSNVVIDMLLLQGGTFIMGGDFEQGNDCESDEIPAHQVVLSDFYIGKYEVTQAQWDAVMNSNPSNSKGAFLPVEQVSWNDVQEFISKLNAQTRLNYRLPTEAEWEYATRGGAQSHGYKYSGSNNEHDVAWYNYGISGNKTHNVGTKKANELGIYDMNGNVWEWCSDWYGDYNSSEQTNPIGAVSGSYRVLRGGSWNCDPQCVRVSTRSCSPPDLRYYHVGFRLARSPKQGRQDRVVLSKRGRNDRIKRKQKVSK